MQASSVFTDVRFQEDASYLLVGGTGGIGRAVSNWMAERGAKNLIYLSRSGRQTAEDDEFVNELAVQGCEVCFVSGSVARLEDVRRAIDACSKPLRGVMQMAAALRDRTFRSMTHEEWTECLDPKVAGSWNLHEALMDHDAQLDFFVLFGSLAGVHGNGGQANYAAANTYLESLVHHRRGLGLPCSLLILGPVSDVGMLSRDEKLLGAVRSTTSVQLLTEADVCHGLGIAIAQSPPGICAESLGASERPELTCAAIVNLGMSMKSSDSSSKSLPMASSWADDVRFALYANLECNWQSKATIVDDRFRMFMAKLEENPAILNQPQTELVICREIARLMMGYLGSAEISDDDIGNIAIDSLMAIEIKDWVRGNMNLDVSMDQTSRSRTSGELASHTVERLKVKYGLIEH